MRAVKNISWIIGESFDDGGDGHTFFHYANGVDQLGNKYSGVAIMVDEYLEGFEDVEKEEEVL
jgi:methylaspartate ammonia-lyase